MTNQLPVINEPRTEFGAERSHCACDGCKSFCRHMPGFLIPSDLDRMLSDTSPEDSLAWAEQNLCASPGALVAKLDDATGELVHFYIPTIVMAHKSDGSCAKLGQNGECQIYADAPFGCAFFSCSDAGRGRDDLAKSGVMACLDAWRSQGLYAYLWAHLYGKGITTVSAADLRKQFPAGFLNNDH